MLGDNLPRLVRIMARLRSSTGCPWDREQTLKSLRPFLVEETYEVLEVMESASPSEHCEELGDLLFQIVFQSQIRSENEEFTITDVVDAISEKLERRHPHVFGELGDLSREEIRDNWARMKAEERREQGKDESALAGVPTALPALLRADRLGRKAADVGFDWPNIEGVFDKVEEETAEIREAIEQENPEAIEHEVGDLLFAVVNVARHLGVDPSTALHAANGRFESRFRAVEEGVKRSGHTMRSQSLENLEARWQAAKRGQSE